MTPTKPLGGLAALLVLLAAPAPGQSPEYRYQPQRLPLGQALHYLKSQRDGSHPARISVYLTAPDRIESLKWERGGTQATLVVARMDWTTFSVRAFEAFLLARDTAPEPRARLVVDGNQLAASFMEQPLTLTQWPWHSYDFDFTSLNLTLPHRLNPRRELRFQRTDVVFGEPLRMAELGEVTLRYVGREQRRGKPAWRYTLGGPGLQGLVGDWWVDPRSGLMLEYDLPVGDEPGYDSVRLRLDERAVMTPEEWRAFKLAAVSGS